MDIKLKQVTEGKTRLFVPDPAVYKTPENAPVFYNPMMKTDRDISVIMLKKFLAKKAKIADIMSGLGTRAVRYAHEADLKVYANDIQPSAVKLIKKNAKLNKAKITTSIKDANLFLLENKYDKFDCIDIDPFGSPMQFLNSATRAISPKGGILCVTATDLGALSGNYPTTCFRRYFIKAGKSSFEHELGIRNLITVVFREAAKYNFSIEPLLSYYNLHYYRTFVRISGGKKSANRGIRGIGHIGYCKSCDYRQMHRLFDSLPEKCACGQKLEYFGPTWLANISDGEALKDIRYEHPIIGRCYCEADLPDLHYDLHVLAKALKRKEVPKLDKVLKKLEDRGYRATRTQFTSHGFKTNADYKAVKGIL